MKPGIVLTSLSTQPSAVRKKSTRTTPRQSSARTTARASRSRRCSSRSASGAGTTNSALPSYLVAWSKSPGLWISSAGETRWLPSGRTTTATSISRPTSISSTSTRLSWANAAVSAGVSSAGCSTSETPRLDPAATGLTTAGPVQRTLPAVAGVTRWPGAVRTPTASATSFVAHLSIARAPAITPDPTHGRPARSQRAASVPSSPPGPCSAGSTTSQVRSTCTAPARPIGRPPRSYQVPSRPMVSETTS